MSFENVPTVSLDPDNPADDARVGIASQVGEPYDGQGAGVFGKGSIYIDRETGRQYVNTGTLEAPVWSEALAEDYIELTDTREGPGSHQTVAGDLTLDPDAGTSDAGDTDFLAAGMFNLLGENLTKTNNYLAGVIGENSVTGTNATDLPNAAVLGIVADGNTTVDGIVTALIDGSDPGSTTTASAAFAARQLNTESGSGVDYGLDLHDTPADIFSDPALPLDIKKADIRLSGEICIFSGSGVPVDGTTGDDFAGKGSIYIDADSGLAYSNTGTKTSPAWTAMSGA